MFNITNEKKIIFILTITLQLLYTNILGVLKALTIWSKVMRMHIGLIICHFLVSAVSITESPKNKIMGKTGFYGLFACRGSAIE